MSARRSQSSNTWMSNPASARMPSSRQAAVKGERRKRAFSVVAEVGVEARTGDGGGGGSGVGGGGGGGRGDGGGGGEAHGGDGDGEGGGGGGGSGFGGGGMGGRGGGERRRGSGGRSTDRAVCSVSRGSAASTDKAAAELPSRLVLPPPALRVGSGDGGGDGASRRTAHTPIAASSPDSTQALETQKLETME